MFISTRDGIFVAVSSIIKIVEEGSYYIIYTQESSYQCSSYALRSLTEYRPCPPELEIIMFFTDGDEIVTHEYGFASEIATNEFLFDKTHCNGLCDPHDIMYEHSTNAMYLYRTLDGYYLDTSCYEHFADETDVKEKATIYIKDKQKLLMKI